ncbi:MAG: S1C family serine protease [Myxococcaceae bacterium]
MNPAQLSESFASLVSQNGNSVLRIEARRRWPASGVVWSADGLIVTTHHAVEFDEDIEVGLPDGGTVSAALVGRDPSTDLALLRADSKSLTPAQFGGLDALKVGNLVLALARPGRSVRATLGIVSALGSEEWRTWSGGKIERYLQPDVSAYPGFSGGALVDSNGKVLGVNSWGLMRGHPVTIPTATLKRVVDTLLSHGQVRRGWLGVSTQPVRLPGGEARGLLVSGVANDSPASKAGLLLGDVITEFDGQKVEGLDELLALLDEERIGKEVAVKILRAGNAQELKLTVSARK